MVREYLTEMAIMLGHSGVEIFPKQDTIIVERGDVGNFINMPYFDAEMPQRFCFDDKDGEAMELDEFLVAIDKNRVAAVGSGGYKIAARPRRASISR